MNRDLTELLDPELKGPIKTMLSQTRPMSEDVDYSRRLIAAGVPTELHVYPGGCHAFDTMVPGADISKRFIADMQRALKRALHS